MKLLEKIKKITNSKIYEIIIDSLIIFCIIFQDIYKFELFGTPFYKYVILLILGLLLIDYLINKRSFKIKPGIIIILILLYSYSFILSFNKKMFIPAIFFIIEVVTYSLYIQKVENKETFRKKLFNIVLFSSIIISILGLIQFLAYQLKITIIYKLLTQFKFYLVEGRITSIYSEPAHLCTLIGGGIFISMYYILNNNKFRYYLLLILFILVGYLSQSVVTYAAMVIFIILFYVYFLINKRTFKNPKKSKNIIILLIVELLACLLLFGGNSTSSVMQNKILGLFRISESEKLNEKERKKLFEKKYKKVKGKNLECENYDEIIEDQYNNQTSYAIKSNLEISIEKLKDGYVLGTGIFTHEYYYDKYMEELYPCGYVRINYTDACSMFIRIFSEFGIVGLAIFCLLLLNLLIKSIKKKDIFLLFVLILFVTQSMRLGEYNWVLNCFTFVILINNLTIFKKEKLIK